MQGRTNPLHDRCPEATAPYPCGLMRRHDRTLSEGHMAHFRKAIDQGQAVPKRCHRCGLRIGTVRLYVTAPAGTHVTAEQSESWICDECLSDVHGDAPSN